MLEMLHGYKLQLKNCYYKERILILIYYRWAFIRLGGVCGQLKESFNREIR